MTHNVHDVPGDGSCFYRALYRCMKHSSTLESAYGLLCSEDEGVSKVRRLIADTAREDPLVQGWLRDLRAIVKECPEAISDFPFLEDQSDEDLTHNIEKDGVWASEFEFRVAQLILERAGVKLLVVKSPDMDDLTTECNVEDEVYKLLQQETAESCICLVQICNNNYMNTTHDGRRLINVESFRNYLRYFLEDDD